ncbi:MAG: histidine--tRNA ligase [bacterium]|nr:histidine--tRNA ligase [bacterium]
MATRETNKKPEKKEHEKEVVAVPESKLHLLRGFKDIFPTDQPYWDRVRALADALATSYGYERMDTPILEETALFTRAASTSAAGDEQPFFSFTEYGGEQVTLRPEGRTGVVRAYIEHGMVNHPQPVKLWYLGPMFRSDRPQAGRLRQFHQFGLEALGELHPAADAELIAIAASFFRDLGIAIVAQVNSIGCSQCREKYLEELTNYLKVHRTQLSEAARAIIGQSPFTVLESRAAEDREVIESAPQMVDWLCEPCKQHFIRVLEYLDEYDVSYALAPFLVRGVDSYTRTIFELLPAEAFTEGSPLPMQNALAAGGRYDTLVERLGGRATPATGIAFGLERIVAKYKEAIAAGTAAPPAPRTPDVYLAQLGDQAKRKAMRLFDVLRKEEFTVAAHFSKDALKAQLEHANRLQAKLTLILGQKEVIDETIIIREMSSGIQEIVPFSRIAEEVKKRLEHDEVHETVDETLKVAEERSLTEEEERARVRTPEPKEETAEDEEEPGAGGEGFSS